MEHLTVLIYVIDDLVGEANDVSQKLYEREEKYQHLIIMAALSLCSTQYTYSV